MIQEWSPPVCAAQRFIHGAQRASQVLGKDSLNERLAPCSDETMETNTGPEEKLSVCNFGMSVCQGLIRSAKYDV